MNTDHYKNAEEKNNHEAIGMLLADLLDEEGRRLHGSTQRSLPIREMCMAIWTHRRLFYKVFVFTAVFATLITLSIPNYYTCKVMLAPELTGGAKNNSSLASLASNFGINLSGNASSFDALMPTLYPDLMNSVAFRTSLFPVKVQSLVDDDSCVEMTYYEYLQNEQHYPWWKAGTRAVVKFFSSIFSEEEKAGNIDPFKLTKDQFSIVEDMEDKVVCDVDPKTQVITIKVTDQDACVAATMADSVQHRLQDFITDYRTRKSRVDLEHYKRLYEETKIDYEKALNKYASFSDANQKVFLQRVRSMGTLLENEASLQYQAYSQVVAQLKVAEAKVQEATPAFTTLQPATVPVKKAGPKRVLLIFVFLFLSLISTSLFVFWRERKVLFH